ncbi:serine/threonine-protein kinase TBK1-like isoform X2 [Glandiceps talaboti]
MTSSSSTLRSSKHFIWNTGDVLGTGATGAVYRGRNKKSGDVVAVKTFNHVSYMRPYEVQMREFEVLLKLSHENIVKLHTIEEEQSSRQNVIVMELCVGSLYTMLDEPESAYGLSEVEFKQVLKDVAAGMNHLRERNVVHRDLKPGNIMRCVGDDGHSIYKLADFGAARELDDNQQFMSLYGTEEYLHPDLYERAVLRKPMGKTFSASVDLWSIGVTLFHIAAGHLPFRPYGGRRNRETMYYITTEKASGVISGVQKEDGGEIVWSRELPKTSQLSQGLRDLVTPVLAGLMECDPSKMWTFDKFISETDKILSMKVIDVFNVTTAKLHKIYVQMRETYAEFQDLIAAQTEINSGHQELYLEYESFCPDPLAPCSSYADTLEENPIYLFRKDAFEFPSAMPPHIPKLPKIASSYSLESDAPMAKMAAAVMHYIKRTMLHVILMQRLMKNSKNIFQSIVKQELKSLKCFQGELKTAVTTVNLSMDSIRDNVRNPSLHMLCKSIGKPAKDTELALRETEESVIKVLEDSVELSHKFDEVSVSLNDLYQDICVRDTLTEHLRDASSLGCQPDDKCVAKLDVLLDSVSATAAQFKKDKAMKRLSYNDEQIHKFEKIKMNTICVRGISLYQDHCDPNLRTVHKYLSTWFKVATTYRREMTRIDGEISELQEKYDIFAAEKLQSIKSSTKTKVDKITQDLDKLLKDEMEKKRTTVAVGGSDMMNGHDGMSLPKSPKHKVLVPKGLKAEIKIWNNGMRDLNDSIQQNSQMIEIYKNMVEEKQKGADKDFDFDEEK